MTLTPEAVVRKFLELAAEDDTEVVLELLDPSVVMFGTQGGLDARRVIQGPDALLSYLQEIEQAWDQFEFQVERVIESDDTVVAFLREIALGRGAVDVQNETAMVFKVRNGRIVGVKGYLDRDEALEAAGLRK